MKRWWLSKIHQADAERAARARAKAERDLAESRAQAHRLESEHSQWQRTRERNHITVAIIESWTGGNPS